MSESSKSIAKMSASFGAATAALYAAPEVQADVVGLSFNPVSVQWTSSSTLRSVGIFSTGGASIAGFNQWNDSVGKTFAFSSSQMASWRTASAGEDIFASTFVGDTGSWSNSTDATGTVYMAFRTLDGKLGWFSTDLGGSQGAMVYTGGQYGNAGESLTVGDAIPAPGGLLALAMGATGLRGRRRKAMAG